MILSLAALCLATSPVADAGRTLTCRWWQEGRWIVVETALANEGRFAVLSLPIYSGLEDDFRELAPGSRDVERARWFDPRRVRVLALTATLEPEHLWYLPPTFRATVRHRLERSRFPRDLSRVRLRVSQAAWLKWTRTDPPPYQFDPEDRDDSYYVGQVSDWKPISPAPGRFGAAPGERRRSSPLQTLPPTRS